LDLEEIFVLSYPLLQRFCGRRRNWSHAGERGPDNQKNKKCVEKFNNSIVYERKLHYISHLPNLIKSNSELNSK
jgi:hypothetical protein